MEGIILKTFRRIFACVLIFVTAMSLVSVSAASISLNQKKAKMNIKDLVVLKLEGAEGPVTWYSSDNSIVTVTDEGVCRAKNPGTAKIVAKYEGKKYKCKVTVLAPHLNKTEASLDPGKTLKLKLAGTTAGSFSSSDDAIATVSASGKVQAVIPGTAVITVTDKAGNLYTCQITVTGEICEHFSIADIGYDATCTATGLTNGSHCSKCHAVLKAQQVIPMKAHTYDQDGYCTVCGAGDPEIYHVHSMVTIPAVEATCTTDGKTPYVYCSTCNMVMQVSKVIKATGHKFVNGYCQNCGEPYVHTHTTVVVARKEPTCTKNGTEEYSYCSTCGEYFIQPVLIPALGHEYEGGDTCIRCGADIYGHVHTFVKIPEIPVGCQTFGYTEAIVCSDCGYEDKPRICLPPTGHYDFDNDGKCDSCKKDMPKK